MALPDFIAKLPQGLATAVTSRRALAASPVVAVALVAGIAMASNRTDPAKVETRDDVAVPARRLVSTSRGMGDALDAKAKADAAANAKKAKVDAKAKADAQVFPQDQGPVDPVPTAPPGESDQLRAPEPGQPTPVDLTAGLIGPVPPVAWPEGCRCAPTPPPPHFTLRRTSAPGTS